MKKIGIKDIFIAFNKSFERFTTDYTREYYTTIISFIGPTFLHFIIETKNPHNFKVDIWCGIFNAIFICTPLQQRIGLFFQPDGTSIHSSHEVQE